MKSSPQIASSRLKLLLVILLLLGICFRFTNLDGKIYWHDEVYTSQWVSGYSRQEVKDGLFVGQPLSIDSLQKYQHLNPDSTVKDTVNLLAEYDTQHPPLYYVIVRLWVEVFGDSIASIRGISAVLSLFALPFAYWLGLELFRSKIAAGILVGLTAVSPFQVLYAQEAREYGLWLALIFLTSAALLKAIRKPSRLNWGIYTLSVVLGLYTFLFTVLVMGAHGLYVLVMQRFRLTQILARYVLSTLASCLLFLPWLIQLATSESPIGAAGWTSEPMSVIQLLRSWIANASRTFFDINLDSTAPLIFTIPTLLIGSIFISFSVFFLCWKSPARIWLFVLLLGGFTASVLILPDLLVGGRRSSISRYLIPTWLSMQLSVAYWFSLVVVAKPSLGEKIQKIVIALVFSASIISDIAIVQSDTWWTKKNSHHHPKTAQIINQFQRPLLISSDLKMNQGEVLSLSHRLDPDVQVLLVREPTLPQIPDHFDDVFLFNPSPRLKNDFETADYLVEQVYREGTLWRIARSATR